MKSTWKCLIPPPILLKIYQSKCLLRFLFPRSRINTMQSEICYRVTVKNFEMHLHKDKIHWRNDHFIFFKSFFMDFVLDALFSVAFFLVSVQFS